MKYIDPTFLHPQLQAGLLMIENSGVQSVDEEELEPLRMEHFYFPLILLVGGLVLSFVSFIAEIKVYTEERNVM